MTQTPANNDPLSDILARHGSPKVATLADDVIGTYLRIADMLGVPKAAAAPAKRASAAAVHSDLAAIAATAGDLLSFREHYLTAARLATDGDDLAAMMQVDAQLAVPPGPNSVFAIYDLSKGPVSYDFLHYLMLAEQFRLKSEKLNLHVIFVPAAGDGFRHVSQYDQFAKHSDKLWRLANLLGPCALLVPNCVGVTVCQNRDDAAKLLAQLPVESVFPPRFSLEAPTCPYGFPAVLKQAANGPEIRALQAPALAAAMVQRWFAEIAGGKPVVSITVRQRDYQAPRNSNLAAWRQFAQTCVNHGFHPVILPDTEAYLAGVAEAFDGFSVLNLPALSIGYRMAIYQQSFVNAMVNNGPWALCAYHPTVRYLIFKSIVPSVHLGTAEFLASQGLMPGRQLPFAGPQQTFVWEDDDADSLNRHFIAMVEAVLAPPASAPALVAAGD